MSSLAKSVASDGTTAGSPASSVQIVREQSEGCMGILDLVPEIYLQPDGRFLTRLHNSPASTHDLVSAGLLIDARRPLASLHSVPREVERPLAGRFDPTIRRPMGLHLSNEPTRSTMA